MGTVLGGSSLVKPPHGVNYYLSMRCQNKKWLEYKMAEMSKFFKNKQFHQYGKTYRCNSCCSKEITGFYDLIYEGTKRRPSMDMLNTLTDTAFAVWYLDSGGKTGRDKKNVYLNTTKFGSDSTKIVMQFFNEVGWHCNINHDGSRLKILFSVEGSQVFLKSVWHRFPEFMLDRI